MPTNVAIPNLTLFFSTFRQILRQGEDVGKFYVVSSLPDSGANRSIFHPNTLTQHGITVNDFTDEVVTVADAGTMACTGFIFLRVRHGDDPSGINEIIINALVSPSMHEAAIICYNDLVRLKVLPKHFPDIIETSRSRAVCAKANTPAADSIEKIVNDFRDVFDSTRLTPVNGDAMTIVINRDTPGYRPLRIATARQTALHFVDAAVVTLRWFLSSDVLEQVGIRDTTEWCSPGFFVPKPASASVRLVVDYTVINKYISRSPHPFHSARDVLKQIKPDSRFFGIFDVTQGYYQILLDEASRPLTTFLLPQGRFRFKRAPMGMVSSSDFFNYTSDRILEPVDVVKIVDDGLVQDPEEPPTYVKLRNVCKASRDGSLTLNPNKLRVDQEVEFAGFMIGKDGIRAEPYKLAVLHEYPPPKNLQELRSFLGAAQQLAFFIPDLAHVSAPLRPLLQKKNAFVWLPIHQTAFDAVKHILSSDLIVKPFDPTLRTRLLCDASRLAGLGYALCNVRIVDNEERISIVQYNSRALSPPQQRYAVNELGATKVCFLLHLHYFEVPSD